MQKGNIKRNFVLALGDAFGSHLLVICTCSLSTMNIEQRKRGKRMATKHFVVALKIKRTIQIAIRRMQLRLHSFMLCNATVFVFVCAVCAHISEGEEKMNEKKNVNTNKMKMTGKRKGQRETESWSSDQQISSVLACILNANELLNFDVHFEVFNA